MNGLPLPEWLLSWLSVDVESLRGGSASLRFSRFPEGEIGLLALLFVAAGFAAVVFVYLREGRLGTWKKLSLAALRCLLLAAMAAIVFYPVLEVNRARDLRAVTLVLLDESLSFGIQDRYLATPELREKLAAAVDLKPDEVAEASRADLAARLLNHPKLRLLGRLAERNLLRVYTFHDEVKPLASARSETSAGGTAPAAPGASKREDEGLGASTADDEAPDDEDTAPAQVQLLPRGVRTDLASTLRQAVEQQGGARVAAAVVFSDGRRTAGEDYKSVAAELRRRGIPVHAVGVGDPSPPRNLRVTDVLVNERVFASDPAAVDVRIRQQGFPAETVSVELLDELQVGDGPPAPAKTLASVEVSFEGEVEESLARFRVDLKVIGRHRLTARIAPRPEESFQDDNSAAAVVEAIEEASKVLLIAGSPSYEYRYLQNLLRRDRRVHVAAWLMSADADFPQEGDVSLRKLPAEIKELVAYDVVVLLDIDPDGLLPGFAEMLESFVGEHRGGLLYVAGEKYAAGFFRSQSTRPIRDLLPVVADLSRVDADTSDARFYEREWPLVPTLKASSHPATRLSSQPDRNRQRWEEISGSFWSLPLAKTKPAANVLLVSSDPARAVAGEPLPVLVWQFYEGGRTMFLGSDETWRWRSTTEEVYDQFWMQTVRYLTEGRLSGGKRQLLQTDSDAYELGDVVRVSAMQLDENFAPIEAESLRLSVAAPDGQGKDLLEVPLEPDPTAKGWYRGVFVPGTLGEYHLQLEGGAEKRLRVERPELEFREPQLDEAALRGLAEGTGGGYHWLWEAAVIADLVPDRRRTVVTTDEPIPLWDNWLSLAVLAGLLTIEWIGRKWNRLL